MATTVTDKDLEALIKERDSYDSDVRLGYIHSNLDKCKSIADKYGIPMVAIWSNPGCAHCHDLERPLTGNNSPSLKKWMQEESQIIFCFVADKYDELAVRQGSENGDGKWYWFCKRPNMITTYPMVRLYWYKNGQKICDVSMNGDKLDKQQGIQSRVDDNGNKVRDYDKAGLYIIEGIKKYMTGYTSWDKKHSYKGIYDDRYEDITGNMNFCQWIGDDMDGSSDKWKKKTNTKTITEMMGRSLSHGYNTLIALGKDECPGCDTLFRRISDNGETDKLGIISTVTGTNTFLTVCHDNDPLSYVVSSIKTACQNVKIDQSSLKYLGVDDKPVIWDSKYTLPIIVLFNGKTRTFHRVHWASGMDEKIKEYINKFLLYNKDDDFDDNGDDVIDTPINDDENNKVEVTYLVTFKNFDGSTLKTQTLSPGGTATPPETPSRNGYTFIGWSGSYSNVYSDTICTALFQANIQSSYNYRREVSIINRETTLYSYNNTIHDSTINDINDEQITVPDQIVEEDDNSPIYDTISDYDNIKNRYSKDLSTGNWYCSGKDSYVSEFDPVYVLSTALQNDLGVVLMMTDGKFCSNCQKFDKYSSGYKLRDDIVWIKVFNHFQDLSTRKVNGNYLKMWDYLLKQKDLNYMGKSKTYVWPHIVTMFQDPNGVMKQSVTVGADTIVSRGYGNFQNGTSYQYQKWDKSSEFTKIYGSTYNQERGSLQLSSFVEYIFSEYTKKENDEQEDFQESENIVDKEKRGNIKYSDNTTTDNFKTGFWYTGQTISYINEYSKKTGIPLLILLSSTGCTYCSGFSHFILNNNEFIEWIGKQKVLLYFYKANMGNWTGNISTTVTNIVKLGTLPAMIMVKGGIECGSRYVYRGGYYENNTYKQTEKFETSLNNIKQYFQKYTTLVD